MTGFFTRPRKRPPRELDVLVLGAGPAGAAIASRLAERCRVALVSRAPPLGRVIGESLPSSARVVLGDLGLWDAFVSQGHRPAWVRRSLWGGPPVTTQEAIFDPHGHGWHLDRARFDRLLRETACERGAVLVSPAELRLLEGLPNDRHYRWRCTLDTEDGPWTLKTRFIVDATGRSSRIARHAGVHLQRADRLVCVHTWVAPGSMDSPSGATLIEASFDGWWYSADLPDGTCVLAWHGDSDLGGIKRFRGAEDLLEAGCRTALISSRCRHAKVLEPLRAAPANSQWPTRACGDHWLAIGDASLAFDPLASQGLLHSLVTGETAALAVFAHLDGDNHALTAWDRQIQSVMRAYLANHRSYYGLEQRWPDETFWQRRAEPSAAWIATAHNI